MKYFKEPLPLQPKEPVEKNGIIGFGGLKQEFKALKLKMQKGDSIILYTDCLNEAVNKAINKVKFGR